MAQLGLPPEERERYFETALQESLVRIGPEAEPSGIDPFELVSEIQARSTEIWDSCAVEESVVAGLLAETDILPGLASGVSTAPSPRLQGAEEALVGALVEKGCLPALREEINNRIDRSYGLTLEVGDAPGLSELFDPEYEISTTATEEVATLLEELPGGSIGIAGPRGAGKTTLIRSFCRGTSAYRDSPGVAVMVSAPVDYDGREFVLHLFARLCQRVIDVEIAFGREAPPPYVRLGGISRRVLWVSAAVVAMLIGLAILISAAFAWRPHVAAVWIVGSVLLLAGIAVAALSRPRKVFMPESLASSARELLHDIKFQQSFTSGWSGSLKLPVGTELGLEQSQTWAERQQSFPDIVARFRGFVREVAFGYRVVIGIDEMDKIESEQDAQRFLNDIKGIFGVERCFYLVSISEDAMSNFERRGLPFRDAFDSTFDEVVAVRFLDLDDTKRLLRRRVVGLGVPFVALCYCVSGGLPRDVIRVARAVVGERDRLVEERQLSTICQGLIASELARKTDAVAIAARSSSVEPQLSDFLRWAKELRALPVTPAALLAQCVRYPPSLYQQQNGDGDAPAAERAKLRRLGTELVGFSYYAATLLEFFDDRLDRQRLEVGEKTQVRETRLDTLAEARQTFAINSAIAWDRVSAFREAWGLTSLGFPHSEIRASPPRPVTAAGAVPLGESSPASPAAH